MNKLKSLLSRSRYDHSVHVAKGAAVLARKYGWNESLAYQAGLYHDCAKEWPPQKMLNYIRKEKIRVPSFDFIWKTSPGLLHAYVGARLAKNKGWVRDPVSLKAMASHTLGSLNMTLPDKILYVADISSKDRAFKAAKIIRKVAERNLEEATRLAVGTKIAHQLKYNRPLHPLTIKVWNHLVQ